MKRLLSTFILLLVFLCVKAQQLFINKGRISFEKKINIQRSVSDWGISEEAKSKIKKYSISNWDFSFDRNRSLYKKHKKSAEAESASFFDFYEAADNELYSDYSKQSRTIKKQIMGDDYLLNDTIPHVDWKIMHDVREIAGFECRKAVGIINDTVYVVAFYTDEILMRGGPEGFSGLPGMILGLAIPRYNTTWFATKVEAFASPYSPIVPPTKGKKTDTEKDFKKLIEIFTRYDGPKKEKPEDIKKRLYGFVL